MALNVVQTPTEPSLKRTLTDVGFLVATLSTLSALGVAIINRLPHRSSEQDHCAFVKSLLDDRSIGPHVDADTAKRVGNAAAVEMITHCLGRTK